MQKTSNEEVVVVVVFSPPSSFHNSSYFILLERRIGVGFTELFFASMALLKNLKIEGKLFQEVSSWRSVPAKYKGDSVTGGRFAAVSLADRDVNGGDKKPLADGSGGAGGLVSRLMHLGQLSRSNPHRQTKTWTPRSQIRDPE